MAKDIILCADSTCDLSAELIEKYNVHIYPLHVLVDGEPYNDGVDITPDEIYATYQEKGVLPKTAAVNTAEYLDFCEPFIKEGNDVIYINLGSSLSSSHNNCRIASTELDGLYAVDSRNLSTGQGLLVMEAGDRIAKGMAAEDIVKELNEIADRISASFVIDNLEFLHKGGRCSALAMFGANVLKLKPSIKVNPAENGAMGVDKKYRGTLEKALTDYVADQLKDRTDIDTRRVFITHSGISEDRIQLVKAEIAKYVQFDEVYVTRAGCTVSSHCGPNTLGVLFITK